MPSLMSSPHCAGRNFSRSAARKRFTRKDLDERMTGIAWGHSDAFLDEHPEVAKEIEAKVYEALGIGQDLVTPIERDKDAPAADLAGEMPDVPPVAVEAA